jgi:polyhydroxybutyrate depolymerase
MRALILTMLLLLLASDNTVAQTRQTTSKGYNFSNQVFVNGIARTYHVHVPPSYDRKKAMPLVLVFHGMHLNGPAMIYLTNFNTYADKKGFIVVYPNGLHGRWDDGRTGTDSVDDVSFVNSLISRLSTIINIDRRRIYAAGFSNGGYFAERMACQSDRIAAIAVVAASMMERTATECGTTRRLPVMFFVGTADPLVPSEEEEHNEQLGKLGELVGLSGLGSLSAPMAKFGGVMTVSEAIAFWCRHNQCSLSPYERDEPDKDTRDGTTVHRQTYGGYGSEVVYYKIKGGGHTWPGASFNAPSDIFGSTTYDISATEQMADFFMRH